MLQQRLRRELGGDGRWYNPDRDIAYCWQHLVGAVADKLDRTKWQPWFSGYFEYAGLEEEEIAEAMAAYVRYMVFCHRPEVKSIEQALKEAGWFDLSEPAQAALMMVLGQVMTCAFFVAIRDVCCEGENHLDRERLERAAASARKNLRTPMWRRCLRKIKRFFRRLFWWTRKDAPRGTNSPETARGQAS